MSKVKKVEEFQEGLPAPAKLNMDVEAYAAATNYKDFDPEDLITPRYRILQTGSKQVKKQRPEYVPGAEAGMLYNTATKELVDGGKGIIVIPCYFNKEWIEWVPVDSGGGLNKRWGEDEGFKAYATEEKGKWIVKDDDGKVKYEIARSANYYVLVYDEATGAANPAIITLAGTDYKKSKGWATLISHADYAKADGTFIAPPPFYKSYLLTTVPESNESGDWFGFRITFNKILPELKNADAIWNMAKQFRELIQAGNVKVTAEQEESAHEANTI